MGWAVVEVVAQEQDILRRWQDMGPTVWLVVAGMAAVWAVLYGMTWAATDPRRVAAGARTLDLPGGEPPAVVALITNDWVLGHQAVPATLLDLAARGWLAIDSLGDDTLVRVAGHRGEAVRGGDLSPYERMVFEHVTALAARTKDGVVHAQALTTGPGDESERWWKEFRKSVEHDARARGLSRARFSPAVKGFLVAAAALVAIGVSVATTTFRDTDTTDDDDSPAVAFIVTGMFSFAGLSGAVAAMRGERDTPPGREAAAGWLGVGEHLGDNPMFAEHPPAGVAVWDRHLAYGAALGVAHGAVAALPLGAESETEAWSSVGGRWRIVRVRYPRFVPPAYGKHPGWVTVWGLVQVGIGLWLLPKALVLGEWTLDLWRENVAWGTGLDGQPVEPPDALVVGLQAISGGLAALLVLVGAYGVWLLILGLADLVSGRTPVQGVVIRRKLVVRKNEDNTKYWTYVAVDDGTTDRVAAWRFTGNIPAPRHTVVRGHVTRYLRHVKGYEVASGVDPQSIGHATTPL